MEKFSPSDFESKWPRTKLTSPRGLRPRSRGALIRGKQSFNPTSFESKWQIIWEKEGVYQPSLKSPKSRKPRFEKAQREPYYNLMMFPYPSAEGLHVGNVYAFTGVDIHGRFMRMQGYDVFEPIGLDGFGIHSENYALKIGKHPKEQAKISQKNFYRQLRSIGNGFAWKNTLETYDPDYYKWTQWIFVQMFKNGLAYRKKSFVNFCPSCKTVLSDEQVIDGRCERCKSEVGKKEMEQWFFKITDYAERLLQNTYRKDFNWTEKVKIGQRNWIGKKEGINITYPVVDEKGNPVVIPSAVEGSLAYASSDKLRDPSTLPTKVGIAQDDRQVSVTCFTTRPDTNFGATFVVIGPEHSFADFLLDPHNPHIPQFPHSKRKEISDYVKKAKSTSEQERIAAGRKKTGVFTGYYCINQLTNYKMPIYISDFVLGHVGTGAVVGVPGHDLRDFEFAKEFKIPIIRVVVGSDGDTSEITRSEQVQEEEGTMVNSGFLEGCDIKSAISLMMDHLEKKGWGKRVTTYKLRDWCISRQRYWGAPIPMINCPQCGWVSVPEDQLPVLLPDLKDWKPEGTGKGPLAKLGSFVNVACPECGSAARRETDVCDTFLDSSWYFLRYPSIGIQTRFVASHKPGLENLPWDREITRRWLPVHSYIGGAEHTVLHLLYSRFVTMAFKDWGLLDFEEPYKRFYAHGLIIAEGAKMSKSRGNVIIPDEYIRKYGADTLRAYLMFLGPFDQGGDFRDTGIAGMHRFLGRVWRLVSDVIPSEVEESLAYASKSDTRSEIPRRALLARDDALTRFMHRTIKKVTEDLENLRYNTAIAHIMEYVNFLTHNPQPTTHNPIKALLLLLAPFAPHMTEELWYRLQNSAQDTSGVARPVRRSLSEGGRDSPDGGGIRKSQFSSIHLEKWPTYNEKYLVESEVTIVVQVNGKTRDVIKVAARHLEGGRMDSFQVEETVKKLALASPKVQKYLLLLPAEALAKEGITLTSPKPPKVIFLPSKLINFVV